MARVRKGWVLVVLVVLVLGGREIFHAAASNPDSDGDGYADSADCRPNEPTIHPGAKEICDGKDNNCNGSIDEDFDLTEDVKNCGACGVVCALSEMCAFTVCAEP